MHRRLNALLAHASAFVHGSPAVENIAPVLGAVALGVVVGDLDVLLVSPVFGFVVASQVLTMADEDNHVNKNKFSIPFVCGCRNLGEALRRIAEGAALCRTHRPPRFGQG